jgi:drug/metabolite transporter (DMT)-like permease
MMLFASFLFACMGAFAKALSESMSSVEIVFFRNLAGVLLIGISIYKLPLKGEGGKFWLLFFRGFIGFCALLMFFYNIANISLAEAMTFSKTSPIFTAIFAFIFLKEKLYTKGWIGVFLGFIGILFITKFTGENLDKTDWLGVLSGVGAALAYTSIRELKRYYDTRAIVLSFVLIGTIGPMILMAISEVYSSETFDFMFAKFVMPSGNDWIYIVLLGVFSTFAQLFMTKAYSYTKAGIVGTISYSNIVFSTVVGVVLLGDSFPDIYVLVGIFLIVCSGIIVAKSKK